MKQIFVLMTLAASFAASASTVTITREALGSGTPGEYGAEQAQVVLDNNIFHAPQYLPYYPTAASLWPRVVEVPCVKTPTGLACDGYHTLPAMGRGEYLFFIPKVVEPVKPEVVLVPVPGPVVYKEVPVKRKSE